VWRGAEQRQTKRDQHTRQASGLRAWSGGRWARNQARRATEGRERSARTLRLTPRSTAARPGGGVAQTRKGAAGPLAVTGAVRLESESKSQETLKGRHKGKRQSLPVHRRNEGTEEKLKRKDRDGRPHKVGGNAEAWLQEKSTGNCWRVAQKTGKTPPEPPATIATTAPEPRNREE
jgi:hypothetical protein